MGNCVSSKDQWIAKETFHPSEDMKETENMKLLKINKDDKLRMIDDQAYVDKDMYMMKNLNTKASGLVSKIFVAKSGTIECEPWYFGAINRRKAVDLLQAENNVAGSFLVRDSDQFKGDYSLSVKTWDSRMECFAYKHYRIRHLNERYYITESHQYSTLDDLVETCQKNIQRGLACKLTNVCLKPTWRRVETKWNIPKSEITLGTKIGSGNFGCVFKGLYRGVTEVAVKQLHPAEDGEPMSFKAKAEFQNESQILMTLHHPNLVQVIGVVTDEDPHMMVLEFLENGDLKSFLQKHGREKTNFDKLLVICEDIASGMQELDKMGIIHRDLAARNILLDKWYQAKVGDFGLAREGGEYSNARTKFPVRWTAPEALKNKIFTSESDVWSFGVVLWEVFTFGQMPYPNITSNSEILAYLEDGHRLNIPKYESTTEKNLALVYSMMLACWQAEPKSRPNIKKLNSDLKNFGNDEMESEYAEYSRYVKTSGGNARRQNALENRTKGETNRRPPGQQPSVPARTIPPRVGGMQPRRAK